MGKVKIEINSEGLLELFKNPGIQGACIAVANEVAETAGDGYNVSEWTGPHRAGAAVWCNSPSAIEDNLENNTLLKALSSSVSSGKIVHKG